MAIWVVRKSDDRVVDYSENEALRYDDRYYDHVLAPANAKPPTDPPGDYERVGGVIVSRLQSRVEQDFDGAGKLFKALALVIADLHGLTPAQIRAQVIAKYRSL